MSEISIFDSTPETTLEESRAWLRENLDNGAECPCCRQLAKVYRRHLNSSMAYALILIARYFERADASEWLHVPSYLNTVGLDPAIAAAIRGDWAKLVHWDLLEPRDAERGDGSTRVGEYRITALGRSFVHGRARVPSHVYIYNGRKLRREEVPDQIDVRQALGKKFDYSEIMSSAR
jgi:hypothetical protein